VTITNLFVYLDDVGVVDEVGGCFVCGRLTYRLDVCYEAHYCNHAGCDRAIERDLRETRRTRADGGVRGVALPLAQRR
jgi:hypothetical protein